jgi:S1-C subfamily serine protease
MFCFNSCAIDHHRPVNVNSKTIYQSAGKLNIYEKTEIDGKEDLKLIGGGSGFAISDKEILTADHVCAATDYLNLVIRLVIYHKGEEVVVPYDLMPVKRDKTKDLCILHTYHNPLKPVKIAIQAPQPGDKIFVFGAPGLVSLMTTEGYYGTEINIKVTTSEEVPYNVISAPAFGGNSGGPIFNEDGEVVGVLTAGYTMYHHVSLTPTFKNIKEFLKR